MESGLSASVGGVMDAFNVHSERAQRIAAKAPDGERFVQDMAELPSDAQNVKANVAAIRTQDEMVGALLDIFG